LIINCSVHDSAKTDYNIANHSLLVKVCVWNDEKNKTLHFGTKDWEWRCVLGPNE